MKQLRTSMIRIILVSHTKRRLLLSLCMSDSDIINVLDQTELQIGGFHPDYFRTTPQKARLPEKLFPCVYNIAVWGIVKIYRVLLVE